jgi:hypothetical protein
MWSLSFYHEYFACQARRARALLVLLTLLTPSTINNSTPNCPYLKF